MANSIDEISVKEAVACGVIADADPPLTCLGEWCEFCGSHESDRGCDAVTVHPFDPYSYD